MRTTVVSIREELGFRITDLHDIEKALIDFGITDDQMSELNAVGNVTRLLSNVQDAIDDLADYLLKGR